MDDSQLIEKYRHDIKELNLAVNRYINEGYPEDRLAELQSWLDKLAQKYQQDERIGRARYRLYELQALLDYYQHNDDRAFAFAEEAMTIRGAGYDKMQDLQNSIRRDPSWQGLGVEKNRKSPILTSPLGAKELVFVGIVCIIISLLTGE